ncbi:glycosyltransferase [Brachybacterium phenoliresistens]|uniref:glycosyltransferase n=1 Tax=Brachybacterium phenoliresistens TaxID=396014 RepID=UPI0031D1461C
MKHLLSSKLGLLAACGVLLALIGLICFGLGAMRPGAVFLALSIAVVIGMILISHSFAARSAARAREVQQRDTRALNANISASQKATQQLAASLHQASTGDHVQAAAKKANRRSAEDAIEKLRKTAAGNATGGVGAYFGIGAEYEYGERASKAPGHFETFTYRSKSTDMRDVFARSATNLQFDYHDTMRIVRALRAGKAPGAGAVVKSWNHKGLLATARIVANQRIHPSDPGDAVFLFRLVRDVFGIDKVGRSDAYAFSEALALEGFHNEAAKVFRETKLKRRDPVQAKLMDLNAVQAKGFDDEAVRGTWIERLNALYEWEHLAPVRFTETMGRTPLDSLTHDVEIRTIDGPLVTIIVPTFNGADLIGTTLDSLVRQTWKNLEIIVVDDHSTQEKREQLKEVCARYEDVTLVLQPRNLGAYMARNRGLAMATGEFVTVHDDDDWSHPGKVELQARDLIEHPDRAANMTRHARSSEDLVLTRINNNPSFSQPNFSSLMARKDLLERLGGWDTVNRGADAEFRDRLVKVSGQPVEVLGTVPHSFTRTHGASLTAGEIGRGYIDPSRLFYQAAYFRALNEAEVVDGTVTMPDFPRPLNMKPGMRGKHLGTFDVVFATDFRFPGGTTSLTVNEIEFAAKDGLRVGMIQIDSPLNSPKDTISDRALTVAGLDNVEVLSLNDPADVHLLVVRHPTVMQFVEGLTTKLSVGHTVVIVNNPPILDGGTGVVFEIETVKTKAEKLFGSTVDIVPESEVTRSLALKITHPSLLADYDWPGFIDVERFQPSVKERSDRLPVLGRHSRDAVLKWPDEAKTVRELYKGGRDMQVRLLGGISSQPKELQTELRAASDLVEYGAETPEDFLRSLDFWAYFHSSQLTESFGMSTVEAMASGLVVFLPAYMRPNFGDGAIYAEPGTVRSQVQELWADPERYEEQVRRARAVVMERYSSEAFHRRLESLIQNGREAVAGGER